MKTITIKNRWVLVITSMLLTACSSNTIVDKMIDIPAEGWVSDTAVSIAFEIQDKSKPVNLYYSGRYDNNYPYYNLYLMWFLKDSTGKIISSANSTNPPAMNLFDPKTGMPGGRGMGSKKDFLILDTISKPVFPYNGKYFMELKQYMRTDTLIGINAVGIKIEPKE